MLESNFREIHQALKHPGELPLPLVANLAGTRIYDSRYCWGRLWRWFYRLAEWTTGSTHLQINALKTAVLHTQAIFHQQMAKIQAPLKNYLNYLSICAKGYAVHENAFFPARNLITNWNASTKPFLKLISKTDIAIPILKPLTALLSLPYEPSKENSLYLCQKIIDLEGLIAGPLPVAIIKKIIRQIPLNAIDQKNLDKWILKINTFNIPVKKIHQALQALTELYSKKNTTKKFRAEQTTDMESFLENRGCKVFEQNDEKHLKWRQSLEIGQKLLVNNTEIILEDEIYPGTSGSDKTRAYAVKGQPDRIALIANNCVALPLRELRMRKENRISANVARAVTISADGRIALFERMKALNTICWTSNDSGVSQEDAALITVLADLVKEFIKQDFTPSNFSSTILMLNEQKQLTFIKPVTKGPFNFNAIEDFFSECSGGNQRVFSELMERSGLIRHTTAKFYHDILKNALKGDDTDPEDLAGIYKIRDPNVADRADVLRNRIINMKQRLMQKLREQRSGESSEDAGDKANKILLQKYLQHKSAGIFRINRIRRKIT